MLIKPNGDEPKGKVPLCVAFTTLVLYLALAATFSEASAARKKVKPPTREEVAQVWVGWSTDDLYLLRVELLPNGKGFGAYSFLEEEPRTFRITSWEYVAGQIKIHPAPPDGPPSWVSLLRGAVGGFSMKLTAQGPDWKLSFLLRRESEFTQRWNELKRRMADEKIE